MDDFGKIDCGTNIKRLRIKHNLTQAQFAEIIGKSATTVHAYETNRIVPPFDVVLTIGNIFNISVGALLGLNDLKEDDASLEEIRAKLNYDTSEEDF